MKSIVDKQSYGCLNGYITKQEVIPMQHGIFSWAAK